MSLLRPVLCFNPEVSRPWIRINHWKDNIEVEVDAYHGISVVAHRSYPPAALCQGRAPDGGHLIHRGPFLLDSGSGEDQDGDDSSVRSI